MNEQPICRNEEQLTSYLLGDLAEAEMEQVRLHLESCESCRALLQELEPTLELLRGALAAQASAPTELDEERVRRVLTAKPKSKTINFPGRKIIELAAVLVICLGFVWMLLPAISSSKQKEDLVKLEADKRAKELGRRLEPTDEAPAADVKTRGEKAILSQADRLGVAEAEREEAEAPAFMKDHYAKLGGRKPVPPSGPRSHLPDEPAALALEDAQQLVLGIPLEERGGRELGRQGAPGWARSEDKQVTRAVSESRLAEVRAKAAVETAFLPPTDGAAAGAREQEAAAPLTWDESDESGPLVMKGQFTGRSGGGRYFQLGRPGEGRVNAIEETILKSLHWLKVNQAADGSWDGGSIASTSLGLLAFLGHGETPASSKYGSVVENALRHLVAVQSDDGRFSEDPAEHVVATCALNEAYTMTRIPLLKEAARKASALVGVGEFTPWDVYALKSSEGIVAGVEAKDGLYLDADALAHTDYPESIVLANQLLGAGDAEHVRILVDSLGETTFDWDEDKSLVQWFQQNHLKFNAGGASWVEWYRGVEDELKQAQSEDGSWPARAHRGELHRGQAAATALSALMLETRYRFLAIFRKDDGDASAEVDARVESLESDPVVSPAGEADP